MHRPNDATTGHQQPLEGAGEWGWSAAQEAWAPDFTTNRGFRQASRDRYDMEDEMNASLDFNIYDHNDYRNQGNAMHELHSGESHLNKANSELQKAIRALNHGDSENATRYLRDSLKDINGGVSDLRDGMRLNPDDSRKDKRGEHTIRDGIDEISDSRHNLMKALHLLGEGKEEEAMQLLRKGRRALNNGRDDVDSGVDDIESANKHGRRGGCGEREPEPPCEEPRERKPHCEPREPEPPCDKPKEPKPPCHPPVEPPNEPPCEKPKPPCEPKQPPVDTPQPPCQPPVEPPTCEPPVEPPTCQPPVEPPTCEPPLYDKAERHLIWGDPHIQDAKGNNIEDQIEANKNVLLVETSDGASITGHTTSFNNPELRAQEGHDITVFDKEVVNLGDGQRIMFNSDGTAYRVDAAGNAGAALKDDEVVSSSRDVNDKVTYDADTRTLNFSFVGDDKSTISGVITGNLDQRGNYLNTEVKESGGMFGGFMPALRADFTGVTVDSQTGAGAFDPAKDGHQRTNADFFVDDLFKE